MEFNGLLKKIREAHENMLPFAVFRYPESKKVCAYVQHGDELFLTRDFKTSGFVMAPFELSDDAVIFPNENSDYITSSFDNKDIFIGKKPFDSEDSVPKEGREVYLGLVRKAIAKIQTGECQKIVVSRSEEVETGELDIVILLKKLIVTYPSALVYIWFHPKIGMWVGATPETLLITEGKKFKTMSLAGTQKYEGSKNVKWGPKEIEEQRIVTRHIEDELSDLPIDSGDTYTVRAGNLLHLCNEINGRFGKEIQLKGLIDRLHPTSAVCGLPRLNAMDFIRSEENYKRNYYTGFLGEINQKNNVFKGPDANDTAFSKLYVNLRCMELTPKESTKATLYIGGGITDQSDPDSEWYETVQKSLIMKTILFG